MDATISSALANQLGIFRSDSFAELANLIPVAVAILITVAVVFMAIRYFRAIAHI